MDINNKELSEMIKKIIRSEIENIRQEEVSHKENKHMVGEYAQARDTYSVKIKKKMQEVNGSMSYWSEVSDGIKMIAKAQAGVRRISSALPSQIRTMGEVYEWMAKAFLEYLEKDQGDNDE